MADYTLQVELREEFGKGAARRLRRAGKVPAVLYGHGTDPVHLVLDGHATMMAMKLSNPLLKLEGPNKTEQAVVKDYQYHPIHRSYQHLDLVLVKKGEKIEVEVPLHVEGEPFSGNLSSVEQNTVTVLAEATHLPDSFTVSIEGKEAGEHVLAGDVELPAGIELAQDADSLLVNIFAEVEQDLGEESDEAAEGETAEGEEKSED
ncbi:50S ribosomal protein L25/general stress protein Ctc [Brevibacterium litoralis]|uniref:50S ribosomal protein L25/general stress protein Ctc n=1 Tax=Brevibacterium litoralis TaxID=3138935 RepID=UPI0032EB8B0A